MGRRTVEHDVAPGKKTPAARRRGATRERRLGRQGPAHASGAGTLVRFQLALLPTGSAATSGGSGVRREVPMNRLAIALVAFLLPASTFGGPPTDESRFWT